MRFDRKMYFPGGELYPMEVYMNMFSMSIISGEDGNIVLPSFNSNFTNEIKQKNTTEAAQENGQKDQNNTRMLVQQNETEDYATTAAKLAFNWNITKHTNETMTGQLYFDNLQNISYNEKDIFQIEFKDTSYLISK